MRRSFASTFSKLSRLETLPVDEVKKGLVEATRYRENSLKEDLDREIRVIHYGIKGLKKLLERSDIEIPKRVVESVMNVIEVAELRTVRNFIQFFELVCQGNKTGHDDCFDILLQLAEVDNKSISSEATVALSNLVLEQEVSDEKRVKPALKRHSNMDDLRIETIQNALEMVEDK